MIGMLIKKFGVRKENENQEQSSYSMPLRSGVEKTKLDLIQYELL